MQHRRILGLEFDAPILGVTDLQDIPLAVDINSEVPILLAAELDDFADQTILVAKDRLCVRDRHIRPWQVRTR